MSSFTQRLAEDRRLVILRLLAEAPGYAGNESILHRAAATFGHVVSRDVIRTDLSWLAEQGLVVVEEIASIMVATVTQRGLDVAAGTATVPGVQRPSPRRG